MSRWTIEAANAWYDRQPWLVGCNYVPRTAINQLEMWQAETFDPDTIDQELSWAAAAGLNAVRVFGHDLCWQTDQAGYLDRIDRFLSIADRHGIRTMFVLFDSCWHPFPHTGRQPDPEPGVHNSGWVQSPGVAALKDVRLFDRLEGYVTGLVSRFAGDSRLHIWDVWNEPDNSNTMSRGSRDLGDRKASVVAELLPKVFEWVRRGRPTQRVTSGIWLGDWSCESSLKPHEKIQIESSDVISFHCYGPEDQMEAKVRQLQRYGRPLLCTEYMARGVGSTFATMLPILKRHRVAAYQWGLVAGRSQTQFPWDSWQSPYPPEPPIWFHDLFRPDGVPYRDEEVALLRQMTQRADDER